jgi:hypothetical protein
MNNIKFDSYNAPYKLVSTINQTEDPNILHLLVVHVPDGRNNFLLKFVKTIRLSMIWEEQTRMTVLILMNVHLVVMV